MGFADEYDALERRFEAQANADGDVFIPMIRPTGKVDFVLIGSEPSFAGWATSVADARRKVALGYRNSATSLVDFVFHLSIKRFLCTNAESYYVTDISKGAMLVANSDYERRQRYDRWLAHLRHELELVSHSRTTVFCMGGTVANYLDGKLRYASTLPHWSGQAAGHWKKIVDERPADYAKFAPTITLGDVRSVARDVLSGAGMDLFLEPTLDRLPRLPESRKWLAFAYKVKIDEWRYPTLSAPSRVSSHRDTTWSAVAKRSDHKAVDKRPDGGCLWIIGGPELRAELEPQGFKFAANGGRATAGRPAWWRR